MWHWAGDIICTRYPAVILFFDNTEKFNTKFGKVKRKSFK